MNKHSLIILSLIVCALSSFTSKELQANRKALAVTDLRVEYHHNPIGIDQLHPRFSWIIESNARNTVQTAYQLQVSTDPSFRTNRNVIWDTGMTSSDQSIQLPYAGPALQSAMRYYWRVRIRDNHNNTSAWSAIAHWEMGLLQPNDWKADWIQVPWQEDKTKPQPAHMLRHEFAVKGPIRSARAYATSMGLYEMEINGQKVGDQLFTPGWTSFNNRVQYQTFDVASMLKRGDNAIGVYLGDGWYRGFIGWGTQRNYYGETLAFLGQIVITYTDGTTDTIVSNNNWHAAKGPIDYSDIYKGEYYDARKEKKNWSMPGFDSRNWEKVKTTRLDNVVLIAPQAPPVKKIQELSPIAMLVTPQGDTVLDMGQNMIGHIRLKVSGPAGTKIVLRHAETLDKYGNFYTENLRSADQTNTYILKGEGLETWEPRFTFQGFRYLAVNGFPGDLTQKGTITGVVIHSDMAPTAHFESSHPLVNRLQHNTIWGQKGNFLDVPTDCPQRDERMGWTGDIQVFANTANINMQTAAFLTRWMGDVEADQFENGAVPHVVPNVLGPEAGGAAGWADAVTIVPWSLYNSFADTRILERYYPAMKSWVNYMKERAAQAGDPYVWDTNWHFGDWLAFATIDHPNYSGAYTQIDLIATAYFAWSARLTLDVAKMLGKTEDIQYFSQLYENVKTAFQKEFITPNGRLSSDTQTAYLLSLQYDLVPPDLRENAAAYLVKDVRSRGHLTTGFLGTPHLNHVLSEFGYAEDAYRLLMRESYPSWLYPVTMGATTIWERWDGIKPDSTFQSKGMNSFNHYAYGAIGEWLYREVAGIKNTEPGYKKIVIAPQPGGGLQHARAFQETPYGRVASAWNFEQDKFILTVTIPVNTQAEIILPFAKADQVSMGKAQEGKRENLPEVEQEENQARVKLGSGTYTFSYPIDSFPETSLPGEDKQNSPATLDKTTLMANLVAYGPSREILMAGLPTLMQSPWLSQVLGFPLERAMQVVPSNLRVTPTVLEQINQQLKQVK
jgi:alpha-L-rhamnosidase